MSKLPDTSDVSEEPSSAAEAAYRYGWMLADEAIRHLEGVGILPSAEKRRKKPVRVSLGLLMELSAVLRLNAWLETDLGELLDAAAFSPALTAMDESLAKLTADPQAFAQEHGLPPLLDKVFAIWDSYFASSGLEELNADVLLDVTPADEDGLLTELADLLWRYRQTGQQPTGD
jgi:hypothetical protein